MPLPLSVLSRPAEGTINTTLIVGLDYIPETSFYLLESENLELIQISFDLVKAPESRLRRFDASLSKLSRQGSAPLA